MEEPSTARRRTRLRTELLQFTRRPTARRDALIVLLTLVTGATDAIGFLRLGGVFTSVMTGNMVLLGLAIAKGNGTLVLHTGVAFVGYVLGGIVGAKVAGAPRTDGKVWPRSFTIALVLELVAFGGFTVGFEITGGHPAGHDTLILLAVNALGLGGQSAAVLRLGVSGLSTTYLTGTLTTVIAGLHRERPFEGSGRSLCILCSLILGALFGALVVDHGASAAPLLQIGILGVVVATGGWLFWNDERGDRARGREPSPS